MAESEGVKQNEKECGKVFIFTPPRFEINLNVVQRQAQPKRKHFKWEISSFDVDFTTKKSKTASIEEKEDLSNSDSILDLKLNYEPSIIRNSLIAYLEDTFSENSQHVSQGLDINSGGNSGDDTEASKRTAQNEYEFSMEQSEKLFDKMQGFVEMSLDDSILSKSQSSQNYSTKDLTQIQSDTLSNSLTSDENSTVQASSSLFTKLSNCTIHSSTVNVFVVVLQVNPVKEIKIKSGINRGQFVKISSILVGDPTKEYFKLTFWRKAADWVTSISAGDVVVIRKLKVEKWNDECYAQSTFGTTLLNLQRDGAYKVPAHWLTIVNLAEAKCLLKWLKRKHSYLVTRKREPCKDVEWKTLKQFVPNTLVHFRGKIVKVLTYSSSRGKYEFEKREINKIVAVAIDKESSEEVPIYLWGRQAEWQLDLKSKTGHIWKFTFLRVECNSIHGQICLHTTPQSTKSRNKETSPFLAASLSLPLESTAFIGISELLKANINGKASISANVTKIINTGTEHGEHLENALDKSSDLVMVNEFFRELVYLGCRLCKRALKQDHNGIYMRCSYCIHYNSGCRLGVMYYFKPCMVHLSDKSATIVARSDLESTNKLVEEVKPEDVLEDHNNRLFERLQNIFDSNTRAKVVVGCQTLLDENGFLQGQNFELLDLQI